MAAFQRKGNIVQRNVSGCDIVKKTCLGVCLAFIFPWGVLIIMGAINGYQWILSGSFNDHQKVVNGDYNNR